MEIEKEFRIIGCKRSIGKNLETIVKAKRKLRENQQSVAISNWKDWDTSFWIKIHNGVHAVVIDSGVIEEIYKEINKLKKK